jgi:hypothetical protein
MSSAVQIEQRNMVVAVRIDYIKMTEIAMAVFHSPSLLKDFDRDPAAAAFAINGFVAPDGMKIYIADDYNYFTPAEDCEIYGAVNLDAWHRVEIRAGYRTFSCVVCGQGYAVSRSF